MPYVPRTVWCCHSRSPRWIFVAWHWNFAWYVFVRAALGDVNSHTGIFRQDACILYITLMMLYLCRPYADTARSLPTVPKGYECQPPACCMYLRHRVARPGVPTHNTSRHTYQPRAHVLYVPQYPRTVYCGTPGRAAVSTSYYVPSSCTRVRWNSASTPSRVRTAARRISVQPSTRPPPAAGGSSGAACLGQARARPALAPASSSVLHLKHCPHEGAHIYPRSRSRQALHPWQAHSHSAFRLARRRAPRASR